MGVTKIYNKLEALNDEVHKGAEVCFSMLLGLIYTLPNNSIGPISLKFELSICENWPEHIEFA